MNFTPFDYYQVVGDYADSNVMILSYAMSAFTTAENLQQDIDWHMKKRQRGIYGPPPGKLLTLKSKQSLQFRENCHFDLG